MAQFKVIIVGSGLAGNLLGNGLINNDIEVEVYECLARDAKREGYQIRLGASALMGMRACLTKEHIDQVVKKFGRAGGKFASAPILYDKDFNVILNANRFPTYDKSAPISRKILRDILAEPVDQAGKLFYNKSFSRYDVLNPHTPKEKIAVHFDDGTSSECDILIAADGAHSKVNQQVGLNNLKTVTSHQSFLAKVDLPTSRYLQMADELLKSPVAIASDNRVLYFCAYLPDKATPTPASQTSKTNIPHDFDESISSCFFGYAVPTDDVPENLKEAALSEKWDYISGQFRKYWSPKYGEIIDLLRDGDIYQYQGRVSMRPPANWREKAKSNGVVERGHPRVLLVGDAIHAMLPNRGMGGNQAMRDTSVLLPILVKLAKKCHSTGKGLVLADLNAACKEYEDEMIPRGFGWVRKSGGDTLMIADSNTWTGLAFMYTMGVLMDVAFAFYWLSSFVYSWKWIDEAPEFQS